MASQLPPGVDLCLVPSSPPPTGITSNFVNPVDLAEETLALAIVLTVLSTMFVVGRVALNWRKMALADYLIVAGFALAISYTYVIVASRHLTRHAWDVPACSYVSDYVWKLLFAQNFLLGITQFILKAAILVYYFQLFAVQRKMKIAIAAGILFCGLIYLPYPILVIIFNTPREGRTWADLATDPKSKRIAVYAPIHGVGSIIIDIYILALPLLIVYRLQASLRKRLNLLAVFAVALLGIISSVFSCYWRILVLIDADGDHTWYEGQLFLWILVEHGVALIVGCMPAVAALFKTKMNPSILVSGFQNRVRGNTGQTKTQPSSYLLDSSMHVNTMQTREKSAFYYELDNSHLSTTVNISAGDHLDRPKAPGISAEGGGIVKTTKVVQELQTV
ncbi:hypothetical protein F4808DRAFT_286814 [Astrocystis sublimbata]|nr:hypothetical protein F4808DRAFT_286814 [Astrocystis sublimbata]